MEARNPSPEDKGFEGFGSVDNSSSINQLILGMAHMSTDAGPKGEWEVLASKLKCQGGDNAAQQWGSWGHPEAAPNMGLSANDGAGQPHGNNCARTLDSRRQGSGVNYMTQSYDMGCESAYMALPPAVPSSLQHGLQWAARGSSFSSQEVVLQHESSGGYDSGSNSVLIQPDGGRCSDSFVEDTNDHVDSGSDYFAETTDDDVSDNSDSDVSQESHEARKKNRWFRVFFETLDALSVDQINEPTRRWHCPACRGGSGAIYWYRGLQPLMTHAKMKEVRRVKLHRELVELLEEELQMRGIFVILPGETFGRWKGLRETSADHDIVWPPMVVIMNTVLEQDENDKWIGMGSQELLEYFQSYAAVKARHSYGPHGHRGMSVLIFAASAIGYIEAERLHKHFVDEGADREAWEHHRVLFCPGGKRQLYGFLARKEDMDYFNRHFHDKRWLKFEMKSYQETVLAPLRQMVSLENKFVKLQQYSKNLEGTLELVNQKLHETMKDNKIVRLRTEIQQDEGMQEMGEYELFFKEQIDKIHKATEEKESIFEKLMQKEHVTSRQPDADAGIKEAKRLSKVENSKVSDSQVKEFEKFSAERDQLLRVHEECKRDLRQTYLEDMLNIEKAIHEDLTSLMKKYASGVFEAAGST